MDIVGYIAPASGGDCVIDMGNGVQSRHEYCRAYVSYSNRAKIGQICRGKCTTDKGCKGFSYSSFYCYIYTAYSCDTGNGFYSYKFSSGNIGSLMVEANQAAPTAYDSGCFIKETSKINDSVKIIFRFN